MANEVISKALVEKRIIKRGDKWCVESEEGKNLGCKSSETAAHKRLQQIEFFKHQKSLTDDEAVSYLDAGFPVDDAEVGLFVVKHMPQLLEKHLPGKHDQQSHAGSRIASKIGEFRVGNDATKGRARTIISDAKELIRKIVEDPKIGKGLEGGAHMAAVNEINGIAADLRNGAYDAEYGTDALDFVSFEDDVNAAMESLYKAAKIGSGAWKSLLEKHELLEEHAHDEIKADDVKISTGNEDKVEVGDAETVEEDVEAEEDNYDEGAEPEAETASVKENLVDVRAKKSAYLEARKSFYGAVEKHLPGKHDQQSHAGAGGAAGKVAHTSSQLKDAAARQYAKDNATTITEARKKVGNGAKVPTTKKLKFSGAGGLPSGGEEWKLVTSDVATKLIGNSRGMPKATWDRLWKIAHRKSLVVKADQSCLKLLWSQYYKYYSGKWIAAAWNFYKAGKYSQAKQAFEKARDGFEPKKNPKEFNCLDSWAKDAESKQGEQKSLVAKSLLHFVPPLHQTEWRITKANTGEDGVMRWQATTTRFSRDVQGDKVTRQFYEEAARRFKSGAVPAPFFSVAHYSVHKDCSCGHVFKSLNDYICPQCNEERLLSGVTTDIWIDGDQPKAKGIFFPTALGREMYKQIKSDIQNKVPHDECIRISMGFYPDPGKGTIMKSAGYRDFMSGWIEHYAGTRVPVVPETTVEVN